MTLPRMTIYDLVGGEPFFYQLAHEFYERIDRDPALRDMFPDDLTGAKERLALFLIQYFGGPSTYSDRRGHPRLRMRHIPFAIGQAERDAWLGHMLATLDSMQMPEFARQNMRDYFERTATFLINQAPVAP